MGTEVAESTKELVNTWESKSVVPVNSQKHQ